MLGAVLILSASRSDQLSQARLHQVVEYALAQNVERVPYDQESVAIWDDAVRFAKDKFDAKWVDINLGVWMYDYFKHDRSYVLNAGDQVLYGMADGKQVSASRRLPMGKIPEVVESFVNGSARGRSTAMKKAKSVCRERSTSGSSTIVRPLSAPCLSYLTRERSPNPGEPST